MEPTWHGAGSFHTKGKANPPVQGGLQGRGAQGTVRAGCRSGGSSSRPPNASLEKGAAPHPPAAPLGFAARAVGLQEGESWARPALLPPGQSRAWALLTNPGSCTEKILPQLSQCRRQRGNEPACAQGTQMEFCDGFRHSFTKRCCCFGPMLSKCSELGQGSVSKQSFLLSSEYSCF